MKSHSSRLISLLARAAAAVALSSFLLVQTVPNAVQAGRADLSGPADSGKFGANVYALPNGNFVVTDPEFSPTGQAKIGAVYLYDGTTHEQISRMTGLTDNDMVGSGGVRILKDGSFVVASPRWNNGAASMAGAVTACSATTGCPSTVTSGNSLVGSHTNDYVGASSTPDTHYFNDYNGIRPVSGSAYLVSSVFWDGNKGAVTYCSSGSSPNCLGAVSSSNSLVGSTSGDYIGLSYITLVPSGGYIVNSSYWTNGGLGSAGAVIPCPATGCTGAVSTTNSLYGDAAGGQIGMGVTLLTGGGFAVQSYNWGNGLGAVTFCASLTDTKCVGKPISAANSLLGKPTVPNTMVGSGGITALPDGGYLVKSPSWRNDALVRTGALTYCSVSGGASTCTGQNVTDTNSLTGTQDQDNVGSGVTLLPNGAFLVHNAQWHNWTGALTYCGSAAACMGQDVSSANSLVGGNSGPSWSDPTGGDMVSGGGVLVLSSGEYVVFSPKWDSAGTNDEKGAATFCPATGCTGLVTLASSLSGSKANDMVGMGSGIQLSGGALIISSPNWANGAHPNAGAVTYCSTPAACKGTTVEASNSLVSDQDNTQIGYYTYISLSTGGYLVASPNWANGAATFAGAITWCPVAGCKGMTISASNSLVGSHTNDYLGYSMEDVGDNLYVALNDGWQNDTLPGAGSVTLCTQSAGCSGPITASNSVLGSVAGLYDDAWGYNSAFNTYSYDTYNHQLLVGLPLENKIVFFALSQAPGATTAAAANITSTGATLNGTVNAYNDSTTVTFEYGLTTAYGSTTTATQSPVTGSASTPVSKAITGLTPNTTYHFRVVADSAGGTTYGADLTFTTSAVAPTATTSAASNVASTGATLNGTVNANSASTTVTFEYGLTTAYGSTTTATQSPVTGSASTPVSKAISGLAPNTLYHFRVVAASSGGTTNGNDLTFTTAAIAPTAATSAASSITSNGATLNGTVNANNTSTTVTFEYGLTTAYGSTATATQSPVTGMTGTSVSKAISGLTPNTLYHFRVVAASTGGTTNGADLTFTTSAVAPTATTSAASNVAFTGATLNGTVNANNTSTTVTFEYGLTTSYGATIAADQSPVTGSASTPVSKAISGLASNTLYHFRVVAASAAGTTYGDDLTFTTSAPVITISGNAGTGGVTLSYTDGGPQTAVADGSGNYSFSVPYNWSGMVTPSKTGYTFIPDSLPYTNLVANPPAQNYLAIYTPPQVQPASAIKASQFTANWSACPGAVTYYLDVATDDNFTTFVPGYQNLDAGSVTALTLTGLSHHTTYYYRVRASDGSLTSANSGTAQAFTQWMFFLPVIQR